MRGGGIALGHPIGCSGARILVTLLHAMEDRQVRDGLPPCAWAAATRWPWPSACPDRGDRTAVIA